MIKASSWSAKALYLVMALLLVGLSLVVATPAAAEVDPDGVIINSPTTADKAFVQSGGTVDVNFDVSTDADGFGDIRVEVRKGANLIGTTVVAYDFAIGDNLGLVYPVNISATAAAGLYDVIVWARQLQGTGTWQSDTQTDAVRVDNTAPSAPTLVSPASGALTNNTTPALDWSDVADPSTPVEYQVQVDNNADFTSLEYDSGWIGASEDTTDALAPGYTYNWRARARDAVPNTGAWSAVRTFTVDTTVPAAPGLVSPANGATLANNYTPALDWSDITDPSGVTYDVQVDDDGGFGSPEVDVTELAASAYTVPAPGLGIGLYNWRARAVDGAENVGDWSAVWQFTITDNIAPPAPTLVSPASGLLTNVNVVDLDWSSVTDPSTPVEYQVQVDDDADFSSLEYDSDGLGVSEDTTDALADGTYNWRARARDAVPNTGAWSAVRTFTVDATAPAAPTLVSPADGATLVNNPTPALDWNNVTDPSGVTYDVQVDDDGGFGSPEVDVTELAASAYTVPALGLGADTYSWRARAVDGAENVGDWSAVWTFTITDTIAPPAPTLVSPANGAFTNDTTPALDWTDVTDPSIPVEYQVQVDNNANFTSLEYDSDWIGVSTATTGALAAGTYNWRARAMDAVPDNVGAWSVVRTFTIDTTAPSAPTLLLPATGATLTTPTPTLDWTDVTDPSGVTYTVQVDTDDNFTVPILINVPGLALSTFSPTLADGVYYWHVQAVDGAGNTSAWSAIRYFRIAADSIAPTVTVNYPNGGESLTGGSSATITWTATDNVTPTALLSIALSYSSNGGSTWTSIATGQENDGAYTWTVPSISSSQMLVQVTATDAASNSGSDTSNVVFSISVSTAVTVDAPPGVGTGEYFTVDIDISSVTNFDAASFNVVFDSLVLAIADITPGEDITNGLINGTAIPVAQTNQIAPGTVRIVVNVPATPGVTGSGYLCRIRFLAIGPEGTSSNIDLQNGSLSDKNGDPISAAWVGDSINLLADALGDANGDGVLNAQDLTQLELMVVGAIPPTPEADINQDGVFNAQDITLMEILLVS